MINLNVAFEALESITKYYSRQYKFYSKAFIYL